jgi:hypothetical protein
LSPAATARSSTTTAFLSSSGLPSTGRLTVGPRMLEAGKPIAPLPWQSVRRALCFTVNTR